MFQEIYAADPLLKQYELSSAYHIIACWNWSWNTFIQLVMEKNFYLKIHIRKFKEFTGGELFPSKQGIEMTHLTDAYFQSKIPKFNFLFVEESFISNNQFLTIFVDTE